MAEPRPAANSFPLAHADRRLAAAKLEALVRRPQAVFDDPWYWGGVWPISWPTLRIKAIMAGQLSNGNTINRCQADQLLTLEG